MNGVVYLVGAKLRGDKLLPLLDKYEVLRISGARDLLTRAASRPDRPGVVLVDSFGRFGVLALAAAAVLQRPLVVRIRGDQIRQDEREAERSSHPVRAWRLRFSRLVAERVLAAARLVIYNSEYARSRLTEYVRDVAREAVVYNPYTPAPTSPGRDYGDPPGDGLRLLTVTNMDFAEKVFPTVEAVTGWMPPGHWKEYDIHWTIAGDGRYLPQVREAVEAADRSERVHVPGWVDSVGDLYERCDVYVHVTRLDNFPNTTMEAMAAGRPVITNVDSCGVREQVFDGLNGFVVAGGDEFADAVAAYAGAGELRREHGTEGARLVREKWSVDAMRRRMEAALDPLLQDRR